MKVRKIFSFLLSSFMSFYERKAAKSQSVFIFLCAFASLRLK